MLYLQNQFYNLYDPVFCTELFGFIKPTAYVLALIPAITVIHETGHAIAAHLFYQNARPEITIHGFGYKGALCNYNAGMLSKAGMWVGKRNADAITSAAGPIAQMVASLALMYFFPGNCVSLFALLQNGEYAISTFYENNSEHDFIAVKNAKGNFAAGVLIATSVALAIFSTYSSIQHYFIIPNTQFD